MNKNTNRLAQLKNDRDLICSEISMLMNMALAIWIPMSSKIYFRRQAREIELSIKMIEEKINEFEL